MSDLWSAKACAIDERSRIPSHSSSSSYFDPIERARDTDKHKDNTGRAGGLKYGWDGTNLHRSYTCVDKSSRSEGRVILRESRVHVCEKWSWRVCVTPIVADNYCSTKRQPGDLIAPGLAPVIPGLSYCTLIP